MLPNKQKVRTLSFQATLSSLPSNTNIMSPKRKQLNATKSTISMQTSTQFSKQLDKSAFPNDCFKNEQTKQSILNLTKLPQGSHTISQSGLSFSSSAKLQQILNYNNHITPKQRSQRNSKINVKSFHNNITNDQQNHVQRVIIKHDWRLLETWNEFSDYLYLRNPCQIGFLKKERIVDEESKIGMNKSQTHFSTFEEERVYFEKIRKKNINQLSLQYKPGEVNQKSFDQKSYRQALNTQSDQVQTNIMKVNQRVIGQEAIYLLEAINVKLGLEQIQSIQQLSNKLLILMNEVGIMNFYLITMFLNSLILVSYGKVRLAYQNWKKFLRICNQSGVQSQKYKMIAYKYIAKCACLLDDFDKAKIYAVKLLKLAWVTNNIDFELLSYDIISLIYYYKQDVKSSLFFHERFAKGEYSQQTSPSRSIGEQNYLFKQQLKDQLQDYNSFSEDDFDLELVVQEQGIRKWELELERRNKEKNEFEIAESRKTAYKNKFPKINLQLKSLKQFAKKVLEPLGPIYRKLESNQQYLITRSNQTTQPQIALLINQLSSLRSSPVYVFQREAQISKLPLRKDEDNDDIRFKPKESMENLKKMIKIFQFDLNYYNENNSLFKSPNEI